MPYYTKVLQPDETVRMIGRLHWSMYVRGLIVVVLACGIALLAVSGWLPDPDWQRYTGIAAGVIGALGLDPTACDRDCRDRPTCHIQAWSADAAYRGDERQQDRNRGCRARHRRPDLELWHIDDTRHRGRVRTTGRCRFAYSNPQRDRRGLRPLPLAARHLHCLTHPQDAFNDAQRGRVLARLGGRCHENL
jgi:hypothetical protein